MSAIRFRVLPKNQDRIGKEKPGKRQNNSLLIALFIIPGMVVFFFFVLLPISRSLGLSFYKWNGLGAMTDYQGLNNYTTLFNNAIFQSSILHSFVIMILSLGIQLPLALGLALLVGRGGRRGVRRARVHRCGRTRPDPG